ncbi:YeeE/YedE family protein [Pendulispora albinea]|uniref:YeeE/YedE family protein n=1 Tax=Pendulispora albinea TaxID=2741071 RepID=A0ABZ2LWI2_9BACT
MTNFTPWSALLGGALIGASASMLLLLNGRIAGISGILGEILRGPPRGADQAGGSHGKHDISWRAWFLFGLLAGGAVLSFTYPGSLGATPASVPLAIVGGLLVGFGTRLGGGCTSGHGVCGLSRLSPRSMVATLTFMATGIASTYIVRHLLTKG